MRILMSSNQTKVCQQSVSATYPVKKSTSPYRVTFEISKRGYIFERNLIGEHTAFSIDANPEFPLYRMPAPDLDIWLNNDQLLQPKSERASLYTEPFLIQSEPRDTFITFKPARSDHAIHRIFADIEETESSIIEFANKCGVLGALYFQLTNPRNGLKVNAEPFGFWINHIRCMKNLLRLHECSKDQEAAMAHLKLWLTWLQEEFLKAAAIGGRKKAAMSILPKVRSLSISSDYWMHIEKVLADPTGSNPFDYGLLAKQLLEYRINGLIGQLVAPFIEINGERRTLLRPKNLLGLIYTSLSEEIMGPGYKYVKCLGCGGYMEIIDERKKTCKGKCRQRLSDKKKKESQNGKKIEAR